MEKHSSVGPEESPHHQIELEEDEEEPMIETRQLDKEEDAYPEIIEIKVEEDEERMMKRRQMDDEEEEENGGLEDEQAQSALERLKRVCREPAIHMDPLRLGGALRRVIDSTTNAKTKRHYERVHGLFMKNTTSRGIGLEVLKFSMSKHERRFEEEAEKAQTNLRRNAREESYHLGPFPAPGGQGPTAALGRAPQGPSFGGWQPNPRRKACHIIQSVVISQCAKKRKTDSPVRQAATPATTGLHAK
uniref:Uncharacterized protein n=1 Tax=Branchiostoma floridae TaxID=7739 RepID=C3XUS9_BRAFL|eukprot:XP_002612145.1 hypothetical protein BRAFLDRAFT_88884 [Branchiostoma floridae]